MNIGVHAFIELVFFFNFILFLNLKHCISFAKHQNELVFFLNKPRSGIVNINTRSYSNSIFSFLRNFYAAVCSGCTSFHSCQQYGRVPFSPRPYQHLTCILLMTASLTSLRWYLTVVLVCISLMISIVHHLFRCLLATCISFLSKRQDPSKKADRFPACLQWASVRSLQVLW